MSERVRDVMQPASWTLPASCPLPEAASKMRAWDMHEVFVVDGAILCGVLTDTDIVVVAIASGRPPAEMTAGECLAADAFRLQADQLLPSALDELQLQRLKRAPVIEDGRLVGSVWTSDLEQAVRTAHVSAPAAPRGRASAVALCRGSVRTPVPS